MLADIPPIPIYVYVSPPPSHHHLQVSPLAVPMLLSNLISGAIALEVGAKGPNYGTTKRGVLACLRAHTYLYAYIYIHTHPTDTKPTRVHPTHQNAPKNINPVVNSACAASTHALGLAFQSIAHGEADIILAGGAEAAVTPFGYAGFCQMKAMATKYNDDPSKVGG